MSDKLQLRAEMRAARKRFAAENPLAGQQAALQIPRLLDTMFATHLGFAEEQKHRRFVAAVYKAQGSELDAMPVAQALLDQDVDLALPVAVAADEPLIFRRWRPRDPLELDASSVPAPLPLAESVRPDVVFIPLLAVDRRGYRLGQGGGYYDRTLAELRQTGPMPWFIGLCYSGQLIDMIANEAHDERLHGVLTEHFCSTIWEK